MTYRRARTLYWIFLLLTMGLSTGSWFVPGIAGWGVLLLGLGVYFMAIWVLRGWLKQ